MRTTALAPALIALALLCACEDERSTGVILTGDGHVMSNSAENNRRNAASRISDSLNERLGAHWRARTTIAQLPQWDDSNNAEPEWRWEQCDVAVEIVGDGQATLPIAPAEVREGIADYMRRKINHPNRNLKVSVAVENDRARFMAMAYPSQSPGTPITYATAAPPAAPAMAPAPAPASAPEPAPGSAAAASPAYIIQAGDTWAALATAFYGSPALWRTLADANHWNGGNPRVGEALLVPPAPGVAPPPAPAPVPAPATPPAPPIQEQAAQPPAASPAPPPHP